MRVSGDGKFIFTMSSEELSVGLRKTITTPRNSSYMIELVGMVGKDKVLQSLSELQLLDLSTLNESFPYPQLFILSNTILICGRSKVYEYFNGSITLKITASRPGSTWRVIDYSGFICLSNGIVTITKDPFTEEYSEDTSLPVFNAACDFNGQAMLGGAHDFIEVDGPLTTLAPTTLPITNYIAYTTGNVGWVIKTGTDWSTVRNASSGNVSTTMLLHCGVGYTTYNYIYRGYMMFDLSHVVGTVTSVKWKGYQNGTSANGIACILASTYNGVLGLSTYDDRTGVSFGNANWLPDSWNEIEFNAAGISYVQSCIGGNCPLALIDYTYDYLNVDPGTSSTYADAVNNGDDYDQYLEITVA